MYGFICKNQLVIQFQENKSYRKLKYRLGLLYNSKLIKQWPAPQLELNKGTTIILKLHHIDCLNDQARYSRML